MSQVRTKSQISTSRSFLLQRIHSTFVSHLSQATSNTFALQTLDFLLHRKLREGEEHVSTACTHPHEKLGEEMGCALSYLTTAPTASEKGTWNLGNEDRGVKFVGTARAQWSGRRSFFFPAHLAHSYTVSVPHFLIYINNLSLFLRSCRRSIRYWLTQAKEPQCLYFGSTNTWCFFTGPQEKGQEPAQTPLLT